MAFYYLDMDGLVVSAGGGPGEGLTHGRVGMDSGVDLIGGDFTLHGQDVLCDQLGGIIANNVRPEDLVMLGIKNEFHKALRKR